jgi:glutathione S-transferase
VVLGKGDDMTQQTSAHSATAMRLRLRSSVLSPFARKVFVTAHELGVVERLDVVLTDVWVPDSDIMTENPLGKVPSLRTPDGVIPGSTLICEYLDELNGAPVLLPADKAARWELLSAHAIADGVMEAAVAHSTPRERAVERMARAPGRQDQGGTGPSCEAARIQPRRNQSVQNHAWLPTDGCRISAGVPPIPNWPGGMRCSARARPWW